MADNINEERIKIKNNVFESQIKLIEAKRQFILTLCIICGATAGFSASLLNSSISHNKGYLLCSVGLLLFALGWGVSFIKIDIERDMTQLNRLADLLNENNPSKVKDFIKNEKEDKRLDYTLDFMLYPFIGSLVAIFLSFLKF